MLSVVSYLSIAAVSYKYNKARGCCSDKPIRLSQQSQITVSCFTLEYMHIKVMCVVKQVSITGKAKKPWNK